MKEARLNFLKSLTISELLNVHKNKNLTTGWLNFILKIEIKLNMNDVLYDMLLENYLRILFNSFAEILDCIAL